MSIGSLTTLISTAGSALRATQVALDTTAQNIANQNTAGYTRRAVNFQDSVSLSSVRADVVPQRDTVVQQRLLAQTQVASAASSKLSALNDLQNVFPLDGNGTTALGNALDGLWNSFSNLEAKPTDTATRQTVLSAAGAFAGAMNTAASQIAQQAADMNAQILTIAGKVNILSRNIAGLNQQIGLGQDTDGSLTDQRQQLMTQMAGYLGLNISNTENGGITITATNGQVLVSNGQSFTFVPSQAATATLSGGEIGGIVAVRDGTLKQASSGLDMLASAVANSLNNQNASGKDGNGNAGGAIFSSPAGTGFATKIKVMMTDPSEVAAGATGQGSGGNSNASAMANLRNAPLVSGYKGGDFLGTLLSYIGSQTSVASTDNDSQNVALTQLQTQNAAASGVSLDQEAANLTAYQRAYQANARVFAIADQLMAASINLGQNTTVS